MIITQQELRQILADADALARAAQTPEVVEYIKQAKAQSDTMEALRKRLKAGDKVEPGKISLTVKRSPLVSWAEFWKRFRELDPVARLLLDSPEAKALYAPVAAKTIGSEFVSERLDVSIQRS